MVPPLNRKVNWYSVAAIALAGGGLAIGVLALIDSDPFLGLFSISLVCCGGVAALVGLHD